MFDKCVFGNVNKYKISRIKIIFCSYRLNIGIGFYCATYSDKDVAFPRSHRTNLQPQLARKTRHSPLILGNKCLNSREVN